MKTAALFLLIVLIAAAGCKKKYQCMNHYVNREIMIGFAGFQPAELHTVEVKAYKADALFDSLLFTNVYTDTDFYYYGDTVKAKFMPLPTRDYIISIAATGETYRISNMTYNDNSEGISYTHETPCKNMAYVRPPDSITINGVRTQTLPYNSGPGYDIMLVK